MDIVLTDVYLIVPAIGGFGHHGALPRSRDEDMEWESALGT